VLCTALTAGAAFAGAEALEVPGTLAVPRVKVFTAPDRDRPVDGPGTTLLLVGVDDRSGLTRRQQRDLHVGGKGCNCTDTMMLLHLSEKGDRVGVVSIPRDSYVPFARPGDRARHSRPVPEAGKINGAYAAGGPALTVRTVEQATGVRVDHYLEADFAGFTAAVDTVGGATVCTAKWLRDTAAGLDLAPGTHRLDGRGALRYVRARHLAPSGDLGRVRRQQRFVAEALRALADRDPATLAGTAAGLLRTLRADEDLGVPELLSLARALAAVPPGRTEFATVPIAEFDHRVPGWGSTLRWDRPRAARLFAALGADRPLTGEDAYALPGPGVPVAWSPADITVRVSGPGADAVRQGLRGSGFRVLAGGDTAAGPAPARTEVRYDPYWQRRAETVAAALPGARMLPVDGHGPTFAVRPGGARTRVERVVHDRSSVEGAPVTGDRLACGDRR
jgi:LCP family protein required for cell wall assembly